VLTPRPMTPKNSEVDRPDNVTVVQRGGRRLHESEPRIPAYAGDVRLRRAKVDLLTVTELPLTQQYIVGELSSLLAGLEPAQEEHLHDVLDSLRYQVERSPLFMLPKLAHDALDLTDLVCRSALEHGDADAFCRSVAAAAALRDFAVAAGLLP
jgi:hypothetical protein